jgi:hypothetical protein
MFYHLKKITDTLHEYQYTVRSESLCALTKVVGSDVHEHLCKSQPVYVPPPNCTATFRTHGAFMIMSRYVLLRSTNFNKQTL